MIDEFPRVPNSPRSLSDLSAKLHSIAIRNQGKKEITQRASNLIENIKQLYKPEGRPNHHREMFLIMRRTARELDALLGGRASWLLEFKPRLRASTSDTKGDH